MINSTNQPTQPTEEIFYQSLRATDWDEFYGQERVKQSLLIAIQAAKQRHESLDHILLYGPPGLGKTTLSHLISQEMKANLKVTSGTAISKTGDLAAILTSMEDGDILFIDEIHRLPKAVEETLYPAMEDFALDVVIGKGPSARTIRLELPKFTLIGATTRYGLLAGPFRDRFGIVHRLTYYQPDELSIIINKASRKLKINLTKEAAKSIAQRSRGTPRIALKLLKRVRDYAQINGHSTIDHNQVQEALSAFAIDEWGLDEHDRHLLTQIITKHDGGPVGLSTLAATISEDNLTIEEVIEPYLIQIGFLKRTPKGRVVTEKAKKHLGSKF